MNSSWVRSFNWFVTYEAVSSLVAWLGCQTLVTNKVMVRADE